MNLNTVQCTERMLIFGLAIDLERLEKKIFKRKVKKLTKRNRGSKVLRLLKIANLTIQRFEYRGTLINYSTTIFGDFQISPRSSLDSVKSQSAEKVVENKNETLHYKCDNDYLSLKYLFFQKA